MGRLVALLLVLSVVPAVRPGEYCDDFEDGDFGKFWQQSVSDTGGQWKASSYKKLKQDIPDFPQPASGDTVVYLTSNSGSSYVSARLQMISEYSFPAGSNMTFRYWLQAQWAGSGTFEVRRVIGAQEETKPILSLTASSGPKNMDWREASVTIPTDANDFKILIFAASSVGSQDNIAVDDITISGPAGLAHRCTFLTTTTEPAPTTTQPAPTTTADPTFKTSCVCTCTPLPP